MVKEQKIIISQDGSIDELMSIIFLTTMPNVKLSLIDIVSGNCLGYPTYEVTCKILKNVKKITNTCYHVKCQRLEPLSMVISSIFNDSQFITND